MTRNSGALGTVLVIEDSGPTRELLSTVLRRGGYEVVTACDGAEGVRLFEGRRPDLVVLDVHMPELDGWQVLEKVRAFSERPILMLTALSDERSKVQGLMRGADDFVSKPVGAAELLARVSALLRRSRRPGAAHDDSVYDDGLVRVDLIRRSVAVNGGEVPLTPLEFKLLAALIKRPGDTVSRAELSAEAWGDATGVSSDQVKLYIGYLRRKLVEATDVELIETIRGFGYRWRRTPRKEDTRPSNGWHRAGMA